MFSPTERPCRACTRECDPSDFNNFQTKRIIYSELTSLEVTVEDGLPRHLCHDCCKTLDEFKIFKELCHKSIRVFKNSIIFKEEGFEAIKENVDEIFDSGQSLEEPDIKKNNTISSREKRYIAIKDLNKTKRKKMGIWVLEPEEDGMAADAKTLLTCSIEGCKRSFPTHKRLDSHVIKHEKTHSRICHLCNKILSSSSTLKRHLATHSQNCFDCLECNKTFRHEGSFKIHMEKHQGQSFICDKCGKVFQSKRMIQTHLRCHESMDPEKCNHCTETFPSKRELDRHKINQHFNYKRSIKECLVCGKKCKKLLPHQRKFHTVYTTTENLHNCHLCPMKLKSKDGLRMHIRKRHIEERNHQCPECPKRFKDASMLKKHGYFHSGERPVHCEVCSKGFYTKWSLKVHMNVHKKQWIAEGINGLKLFEYSQS